MTETIRKKLAEAGYTEVSDYDEYIHAIHKTGYEIAIAKNGIRIMAPSHSEDNAHIAGNRFAEIWTHSDTTISMTELKAIAEAMGELKKHL